MSAASLTRSRLSVVNLAIQPIYLAPASRSYAARQKRSVIPAR
jgi:hypothetical protein